MSEHDAGQVGASAAEVYDRFFVPALFGAWPQRVLDAAEVKQEHAVLDVACGTGVLALAAEEDVGPQGSVVAVDINRGMLDVARTKPSRVEWSEAAAEALPFEDGAFDRVVSQFGLMFFEDPVKAIAEMRRVTRQDGKLAVAVWASLEATPGYKAVAELLRELFGDEVARSIEVPYSMGDVDRLVELFAQAKCPRTQVRTIPGHARFPSLDAWVHTDIRGWTLADVIDDADYERFRAAARARLSPFVQEDGSVEFAAPAHIVVVPVS